MPDARSAGLLAEIDEAAARIEAFLGGVDQAAFLANREKCDAVAMNLLVICEAAGRLDAEARDGAPEIPWSRVVGLRNRIAHGYSGLDFLVIWAIATQELPALRAAVAKLMAS